MLTCAKKYGVEFNTPDPSHEIQKLLPLWHHHGENPERRQLNNKAQCKCLRFKHGVTTVGQGMIVMERLNSPTHKADAKCLCNACIDDRLERKCKNPHKCATAVRERLTQLKPRWDPQLPEPDFSHESPGTAREEVFKRPPEITKLAEGFRIFSKEKKEREDHEDEQEALPVETVAGRNMVKVTIDVHIERAGQADAKSGAGLWYSPDDPRNMSFALPSSLSQTRQNAEVVA
ncbi:hypothetical protein C8R46DRAFT_822761, partial [Mycena filopes]